MESRARLGSGVERMTLSRGGTAPQVVNVARIERGAPVDVRVVQAAPLGGPGPRLERTSSMCARVSCLVAVNADFFATATGAPIGAVLSAGELVRSPVSSHHQLMLGGKALPRAGPLEWSGRLVSTDLRDHALDGVNIARGRDDLVLYTPAYGPSTRTNRFGVEAVLRIERPKPPLRVGQTAVVRVVGVRRGGDTRIPANGAVLSGHGKAAAALLDLWGRVRAGHAGLHSLLRIETSPSALESVGGTPILVRDGRRWVADSRRSFVRGRHPRTIAGWNRDGTMFLVTVDGRQPGRSAGMSLADAADLMISLGATDAINLDGGGSSTFVAQNAVLNVPSDVAVRNRGTTRIANAPRRGDQVVGHVERPVVNAIAVIPRGAPFPRDADVLSGPLRLPRVLDLPAPVATDPASAPDRALPAIVRDAARVPARLPPAAAAAVLNLAVAAALVRRLRRAPASAPL